ncbi:EamA family transporter [Anderseniella sp. Alg231-50]|uniref:EamA family transporter n=1 Tax=Anderseniella sp. Alg231-50 TaxID=1922226 RepID=UPI000D55C0E0
MTSANDDADRASLPVAVLLLVAGLATASLSGAFLKLMAAELNVAVMTFGRYAGYLVVLLPIAAWRYGRQVVAPPAAATQFLRATLILGATLSFVFSVRYLPLANTVAILYIYPFVVALLSPWLLGERASPAIWFGVVCGFLGILIVMRPDLGVINVGTIAAVATGVFYAFHIIVTRKLANAAPALVSNTYMALVAIALISPLAWAWWQPVSLNQAAVLFVMGAINAVSHLLIISAFARASAPALAPFTYTEIVAAVGWGLLFFADIPDAITFVGIAVIIASGVLVSQSGSLGRLIARRRGASAGG